MAITALEARGQILGDLADALDQLALGIGYLTEAHELLDDDSAERLEDELFRPVQKAFGRSKRTYTGFAQRFDLGVREIVEATPGRSSQGVKAFVEQAVAASSTADRMIAELQDSMLPIESGDPELRAGLAEVRELLDGLPVTARRFLGVLGR